MPSVLDTPIELEQLAQRQLPAWLLFRDTHLPVLQKKREIINGDKCIIIMYRMHYLRAIVGRLTTLRNNGVIDISEPMEEYINHHNNTDAITPIESEEVTQAIQIAQTVVSELQRIMQNANKTALH